MPQDSLYIINGLGDTAYLPDSLRAKLPPEIFHLQKEEPPVDGIWAIILPIILIVATLLLPWLIRRLKQRYRTSNVKRLYDEKHMVFDDLLNRYSPYYSKLSPAYKERFMWRAITFMQTKRFVYMDLEAEEQMPLLISAAAIQLTFGLDHYLLDYFTTIYVMPNSYHYGLENSPFEGHVSDNGIYLSWSNFSHEFANYEDGSNVGLHEMAHALAYVNFTVSDGADHDFKKRFKKFSLIGRPIFNGLQTGEFSLLGDYAAVNYQEFWAVCIENFFERSQAFRQRLPDLYQALCELLNQDPGAGKFILNTPEAV